MLEKIKDKLTNWILGVLGLLILSVLTGIWYNTREVPNIKKSLRATQDSLFDFCVDINTEVAKLKWMEQERRRKERELFIIDSITKNLKK